MKIFRVIPALFLLCMLQTLARAGEVSVAAAANLTYALDDLNTAFRKAHPDVTVTSATGASGNLVAQIRKGAPYDVFLSADTEYPEALAKSGHADVNSQIVFAQGRLVLWTTRPNLDLSSIQAVVRNSAVHRISIANTEIAPYGRAARVAMMKLRVWNDAKPKLVVGENITQTAQFVETGNADVGFVALSTLLSPKLKDRGRWLEVPTDLYWPLDQAAILTNRGATNADARAYLEFLRSTEARKILEQYGYRWWMRTPGSGATAGHD